MELDDLIVKTVTRLIVPFIQLYGIFVILHGHVSPGGGFSGGAIIGASIVLYTLAYGLPRGHEKVPHRTAQKIETGGIFWYALVGLIGIGAGGSYLANKFSGFPMGQTGSLLSAGMIPLVTIGIGLKVCSTIITLFHTMIEED